MGLGVYAAKLEIHPVTRRDLARDSRSGWTAPCLNELGGVLAGKGWAAFDSPVIVDNRELLLGGT